MLPDEMTITGPNNNMQFPLCRRFGFRIVLLSDERKIQK
jgi:hypothetical protein